MAAITTLNPVETQYFFGFSVPNLVVPDQAQGKDSQSLWNTVKEISTTWHLPRAIPRFVAPPDETQAVANQTALALLRSLNEMGDELEQQQTWTYLQQAIDQDRLSDRPLFPQVK